MVCPDKGKSIVIEDDKATAQRNIHHRKMSFTLCDSKKLGQFFQVAELFSNTKLYQLINAKFRLE
jgi:hypothetical protein